MSSLAGLSARCRILLVSGQTKRVPSSSRRHCFREAGCARKSGHLRVSAAAEENDKRTSGSESPESLFRKELEKRGLSTASRDAEQDDQQTSSSSQQPAERHSAGKDQRVPPPPRSANQLEKSRALGSEGVEGLVPRLTELAKLGLTFFLAFGPLILVTAALFGGLYVLFGEEFVHGGRHFTNIPYVDPQDLLDEPTVDPTIPLR